MNREEHRAAMEQLRREAAGPPQPGREWQHENLLEMLERHDRLVAELNRLGSG